MVWRKTSKTRACCLKLGSACLGYLSQIPVCQEHPSVGRQMIRQPTRRRHNSLGHCTMARTTAKRVDTSDKIDRHHQLYRHRLLLEGGQPAAKGENTVSFKTTYSQLVIPLVSPTPSSAAVNMIEHKWRYGISRHPTNTTAFLRSNRGEFRRWPATSLTYPLRPHRRIRLPSARLRRRQQLWPFRLAVA